MERYLKGSTHYLTKEAAYSRFPNNHWNEFHCEADGTWSVYHLTHRPVQAGQVAWRSPQHNEHVKAYYADYGRRALASFPVYDWRKDFPEMAEKLKGR